MKRRTNSILNVFVNRPAVISVRILRRDACVDTTRLSTCCKRPPKPSTPVSNLFRDAAVCWPCFSKSASMRAKRFSMSGDIVGVACCCFSIGGG